MTKLPSENLYEWDVFISYRREETNWTPWVRDHFRRMLNSYLQQEFGRSPKIYVDDQIKSGPDFAVQLADALATSRVLVPIFSKDYFMSPWCLTELDCMLGRYAKCSPNDAVVLGVVVHDGEYIPDLARRFSPKSFYEYRLTNLDPRSRRYEQFSEATRDLAGDIWKAIESRTFPLRDPCWRDDYRERFLRVAVENQANPVYFSPKSVLTPENCPRLW